MRFLNSFLSMVGAISLLVSIAHAQAPASVASPTQTQIKAAPENWAKSSTPAKKKAGQATTTPKKEEAQKLN
ncbi:MAG: hypothetical protein WBQ86_21050, partial [Candidatus Binatus sp.]